VEFGGRRRRDDTTISPRLFGLFFAVYRKARHKESVIVSFPSSKLNGLKDAGFGAVRAPKEYGGRGATLPELFALLLH
jgi:alkylation response protein AidB-like acyl-CoA dehydrogenase